MTDKGLPADPNRRRFFRLFAGDVASSVGSMIGVVQALQETSAEAARELLGADPAVAQGATSATPALAPTGTVDASTAGYRAPFKWDDDIIRLVDQRRLPDALTEIQVQGAADAINAINDGVVVGATVQAQIAAATLAIVASRAVTARPFARRATIRGAANAFRLSRPASAPMAAALDRMLALLETMVAEEDGAVVVATLRTEAEAIILEAADDHGAVVGHAVPVLPGGPEDQLHVMLVGSTGAMGSGTFGTALSVVATLHHEGRPVHALVPEGRPSFEGSRIAAWELRQAGVPHAILTDAAAPGCIANSEVKVVLAGADRIAANGDVIATTGTYPIALAAYAAGVPFVVCATTNAVDPAVATGDDARVEDGRPTTVLRAMGQRVPAEGTQVRNPLQELVPASLITAIVLETGAVVAPFEEPLAAALAEAAVRRSKAAGFAALVAKREAEAAGTIAPAPVDVAALRSTGPIPQPWPDGRRPNAPAKDAPAADAAAADAAAADAGGDAAG